MSHPLDDLLHVPAPAYEYAFVEMDDLNEHAALGWRVVPIDPLIEVTKTLGQVSGQSLKFTMERERPRTAKCNCGGQPPHTVDGLLLPP